jgi:hypothetical protein
MPAGADAAGRQDSRSWPAGTPRPSTKFVILNSKYKNQNWTRDENRGGSQSEDDVSDNSSK